MPCHPDRVRRNYHDITLQSREDFATQATVIRIAIHRHEIASAMSARELRITILRKVASGIDATFGSEAAVR